MEEDIFYNSSFLLICPKIGTLFCDHFELCFDHSSENINIWSKSTFFEIILKYRFLPIYPKILICWEKSYVYFEITIKTRFSPISLKNVVENFFLSISHVIACFFDTSPSIFTSKNLFQSSLICKNFWFLKFSVIKARNIRVQKKCLKNAFNLQLPP